MVGVGVNPKSYTTWSFELSAGQGDGVLFVERAGELRSVARLRDFESRSRSESES
jgi:hypothetical protein